MHRYARRILFSDLGSWWPAIVTVAAVTLLVGLCATQFAWTHDPRFIAAAAAQGHLISEFTIVSETIYMLVAALALFSLTVVGIATVESTRRTFSQWRLVGASPSDVRRSIWALVATASLIGAVPGSILAVGASYFVVPAFNQMAARGFDAPLLPPSILAWLFSLVLGVLTCLLGTFGPAHRASRTQALEVFRDIPHTRQKGWWWRAPLAAILLLSSLGMVAAAAAMGAQEAGIAVMFNLAMNAGVCAVLFIYVIGPLVVPAVLASLGGLAGALGSITGRLAARAAIERASTSANTIAPLAAGIGGVGVILTSVNSAAAVVATLDGAAETNLTDTLVMAALISFVLLITSAAVTSLASRDVEREHSLLRVAGMSSRRITTWYVWQAFLLALTGTVLALVPIVITVATTSISSTAYTGAPIVVVPWATLIFGFALSWLVLFFVQWWPARASLRADIAVGLRAA
ncbi:ABC transporter permease [Actinomyces provencensis]|uniref:ABC transporter permease n=1 Tax=Actinomyces provencensis TaxID=1720198 RepID=UPI00096A51FC|nr:ABC transporter permease [Actinomyces provencensis]